jgi:hypothetical protein
MRWQQKDTENAVGSCDSPDFRQESGGKTDGTSLFHPVDGICPWWVSQNVKLQENKRVPTCDSGLVLDEVRR